MDLNPWLRLIAVVGAVLVMFCGLKMVNARLKEKRQGFGPNTIRAIGIVLFLPILLILALLTDFGSGTLAALLGTVAGYVLSVSRSDDDESKPTSKPSADPDVP